MGRVNGAVWVAGGGAVVGIDACTGGAMMMMMMMMMRAVADGVVWQSAVPRAADTAVAHAPCSTQDQAGATRYAAAHSTV